MRHRTKFRLRVVAGSLAVVSIGIGAVLVVGRVGTWEAFALLTAMIPTARFFCSAVMTGTATVLALMVTLVTLSTNATPDLKAAHYRRVQTIALVDSLAFTGALLLQFFLMIPLEEPDVLPIGWNRVMYYGILAWVALLAVLMVSVVMMLYSETKQIIRVVGLDGSSPLSRDEDERESADLDAVDGDR